MTQWDPPEAEAQLNPWYTQWDELGYLHNHDLRPDGTLGRYRSACAGCERREAENP